MQILELTKMQITTLTINFACRYFSPFYTLFFAFFEVSFDNVIDIIVMQIRIELLYLLIIIKNFCKLLLNICNLWQSMVIYILVVNF